MTQLQPSCSCWGSGLTFLLRIFWYKVEFIVILKYEVFGMIVCNWFLTNIKLCLMAKHPHPGLLSPEILQFAVYFQLLSVCKPMSVVFSKAFFRIV